MEIGRPDCTIYIMMVSPIGGGGSCHSFRCCQGWRWSKPHRQNLPSSKAVGDSILAVLSSCLPQWVQLPDGCRN